MSKTKLEDVNVLSEETLITPAMLKKKFPISTEALATVNAGRQSVKDIINRKDHRMFVVVGPCSIHDPEAALDYANRLKALSEEVSDTLLLIMRVYFEKPRTTTGWKGFINDPDMNDSFNIAQGLKLSRKLLISIAELGLPTSTEALDPVTPQYLQDLIAWSAIGARTTESQTHRELASGLSGSVGFKNGTDGSLTVAINALKSVSAPHRFLGINHDGAVSVIHTRGNAHAHVVLRGGGGQPNFHAVNVSECENLLLEAGLPANIMIDCSHENSGKDPGKQPFVMEAVADQISSGNQSLIGLMVESNLAWGNQAISEDLSELQYGVSVTDGCVDWQTTESMILTFRDQVNDHLKKRASMSLSLEKSA